jgi:trehalose synthase
MAPMLAEYSDVAPTGTVDLLRRLGELAEGKTMLHVNSTRYGGGVAEILHRLLPLLDELGVKTRWEVLMGTELFYRTTKSFHNALQGTKQRFTKDMFDAYVECNRDNARRLNLDAMLP